MIWQSFFLGTIVGALFGLLSVLFRLWLYVRKGEREIVVDRLGLTTYDVVTEAERRLRLRREQLQ